MIQTSVHTDPLIYAYALFTVQFPLNVTLGETVPKVIELTIFLFPIFLSFQTMAYERVSKEHNLIRDRYRQTTKRP